jgi:SNF2 family DNA or RNA helicase
MIETVQVIAFLTAVFGKRGNSDDKKRMRLARERNLPYPRILIICPGSVMSNWQRELQTVCLLGETLIAVGLVACLVVSRNQ